MHWKDHAGMGDHRYEARDRAGRRGEFDEKAMALRVELGDGEDAWDFPARFEVCQTCEGKGSHVNPDVDGHGISAEEFDEDRDFSEDYRCGRYDVPCYECQGRRVVPVIDRDSAMAAGMLDKVEAYDQLQDELAQCYAEQLAERRAGC
jgi:hypothetical protein